MQDRLRSPLTRRGMTESFSFSSRHVCRMKMIGDVRSIIVGVMEKIGAFIKLIAWGMEITVPPSATITDGARIIVSETELIVTTVWLKTL